MAIEHRLVDFELRHRADCPRVDNHDPSDLETCYEQVEVYEDVEIPDTTAPDVNGFLLAAMGSFDPNPVVSALRGNEVLSQWPTFVRALDARNWSAARMFLDLAYQAEGITGSEHTMLVALLEQYHIPEA